MTYLEKIVKHYAGDINLDTGSLQKLAESVDSAQPAKATSESSGFAELDEKFRIQTVSDNTIREKPLWFVFCQLTRQITQVNSLIGISP